MRGPGPKARSPAEDWPGVLGQPARRAGPPDDVTAGLPRGRAGDGSVGAPDGAGPAT